MIKYPETEQLRSIIRNVRHQAQYIETLDDGTVVLDRTAVLPTLKFRGSIKLHGSNAGVTQDGDEIYAQSRSNKITPLKDNAGFAQFMDKNKEVFETFFEEIRAINNLTDEIITIYGEWAGKGIQKGVGIAKLPKAFYVFGIKVTPRDLSDTKPAYWVDDDYISFTPCGIYNINDFKTYDITIDFNNIQKSQNEIVDIVNEIENRCPVSAHFLPDDDDLVGEGVVFETIYKGARINFKSKGEKHSKSRVKTMKKLTPEELEKLKTSDKCAEEIFSVQRCNQALTEIFGIDFEKDIDIKRMGEFLKFISQDTIKEELDIINLYDLEIKDVIKKVQEKAKKYFLAIYKGQ